MYLRIFACRGVVFNFRKSNHLVSMVTLSISLKTTYLSIYLYILLQSNLSISTFTYAKDTHTTTHTHTGIYVNTIDTKCSSLFGLPLSFRYKVLDHVNPVTSPAPPRPPDPPHLTSPRSTQT